MRYISLFSGIGGLDRAIDLIGGECVVQVEREPYCRSILDRRYPDVPKHDDVTTFQGFAADLVVGGPPCQPVSHAGRRKGQDDDRWLWGEALRVVAETRPARVFFENPMGLKTLGLDAVLEGLTALGYGGAWEVVAAADVGAPHLRKRIFIMGIADRWLDGWEGPTRPKSNRAVTWKTPTAAPWSGGGGGGELQKQVNHGNVPTPSAAAVSGGPGTSPKREGGLNLRTYASMWPTPSASLGPKAGLVTPDKAREGGTLVEAVSARESWPTPTTRDWKDSGDSIANGTVPVNGLLGRAVGPTKASGALSPDWVEWLQGLPIGWTDINVDESGPLYGWESEPAIPRIGLGIPNRSKRLTALGNAVVPAQAVFAWHRLSERLGL